MEKIILEKEMKEDLLIINVKNWSKGIYIVLFSNEDRRTVKKVIIN